MKFQKIFFVLLLLLAFVACNDDDEVDQEKPVIDIGFDGAFPTQCDTLFFGETFTLKMRFSDNLELGAYSIDIHHNFDHHSHSTEVMECTMNPVKDPVNPFVFIDDYMIPPDLGEYETNISITVPEGNGAELFDEGDYHFFIQLTDKEGWSTQKGLSIKIIRP